MSNLIVVFNGTGGVGKTSVINALRDMRQDLPFSFTVVPSPTRKAYEAMGLATEKAFFELSQDKAEEFQDKAFKAYQAQALGYKEKTTGTKEVLVFDRGWQDYASYQLVAFPHWTRDRVEQLKAEALNFMSKMYADSKVLNIHFPTPAPWGDSEDDGVRYAPHAKNLVWDSVLKTVKTTWGARSKSSFSVSLSSSTVEARVAEVVNSIMWCRP